MKNVKITIIENEKNTYEPNVTSRIKHDEYNILKSDILSINIFNFTII